MTEHANAELFRRGYAAFGAGDLDTVRSLLADDVVWHNGGNNQLSGDYTGIEATIGLFLKLFEVSGGSFKLEVHDVVANDDHAVALLTASASRDDASFTARAAHVVHMRDGNSPSRGSSPRIMQPPTPSGADHCHREEAT